MADWLVAVVFIVAILLVILIHEAGHFFTAKAFGIKVEEFFVGFGPRLWSTRRGETEYGVKALPFGGYVRIAGMNPFQEPSESDRPRTFGAKPPSQRAAVIAAGPVTHFVIAVLLLAVFFTAVGQPSEARPLISGVEEELIELTPAPGEEAVRGGDLILAVDGRSFVTEESFRAYLRSRTGETVALTVERDGVEVEAAGIPSEVDSPADRGGLRAGDEVVEIDGRPVGSIDRFIDYTRARGNQLITLTVRRADRTLTVRLTPVLSLAGGLVAPRLGVSLDGVRERTDPFTGIGRGVVVTGRVSKAIVLQLGDVFGPSGVSRLWDLLTGRDERGTGDVVGPIGAVRLAQQAGQAGAWQALFELFVLFNVFVGILNLIPLPPFDGGHLAVVAVEKLTRRRVDARRLVPITAVVAGFMILYGLAVVVLDVVNPIPNPFR